MHYLCLKLSMYIQLFWMQAITLYHWCCVFNSIVISLFQFVNPLQVFQRGCRSHQELPYREYSRIYMNLPLQILNTSLYVCVPQIANFMHFPWLGESILNCHFYSPAVMCCQTSIFDATEKISFIPKYCQIICFQFS